MSKQTFCTNCGAQCPDDGKFCSQCGSPIVIAKPVCTGCGQELAENALFCSRCGTCVSEVRHPSPAQFSGSDKIHEVASAPASSDGTVTAAEVFKAVLPRTPPVRQQPPVPQAENSVKPAPQMTPESTKAAEPPTQTTVPLGVPNDREPLWVPPEAEASTPSPASQPDTDEDEDLKFAVEEGEVYRQSPVRKGLFKKKEGVESRKSKKSKKASVDEEEERKARLFQKEVNGDGYYDDRRPIDDELTPEEVQKGAFFRIVLTAVGILFVAVILIQIQGML